MFNDNNSAGNPGLGWRSLAAKQHWPERTTSMQVFKTNCKNPSSTAGLEETVVQRGHHHTRTHTHTHTRTYQAVRRKDASNSRFQCSTCGANKHIYLHTHSHKGTQACKIAASKQYRNSLRFLPIEATLRYHTLRAMNEVTCSKISILKLINHQAQLNHTDH